MLNHTAPFSVVQDAEQQHRPSSAFFTACFALDILPSCPFPRFLATACPPDELYLQNLSVHSCSNSGCGSPCFVEALNKTFVYFHRSRFHFVQGSEQSIFMPPEQNAVILGVCDVHSGAPGLFGQAACAQMWLLCRDNRCELQSPP